MPFNATAELILQFFQGLDIPKTSMGVHLVVGPNGRPNGEAFIEFASEEVADAALAKDRGTIGTRYVEVFRSTPEQMTLALQRVGKSNNMAPMPQMHSAQAQGGMAQHGAMPYGYAPFGMAPPMGFNGMMSANGMPGGDTVVKMRGLPYKATRNDVLDFFAGLSVPLHGVVRARQRKRERRTARPAPAIPGCGCATRPRAPRRPPLPAGLTPCLPYRSRPASTSCSTSASSRRVRPTSTSRDRCAPAALGLPPSSPPRAPPPQYPSS